MKNINLIIIHSVRRLLFIIILISVLSTAPGMENTFAESDFSNTKNPSLGSFAEMSSYEDRQPLYKILKEQNDHTIGWIYIEGTNVDNVLMQNVEDKDFYIDKGFDRQYHYPGTLYISDISDMENPSDVVIVYGHNMKDRSMFGSLREFEDPEFLKEHDSIIVDNLKERISYEITHVMRIRVNVEGGDEFPYYTYSDFEDETEFDEFIKQCEEHVLYESGKAVEFGDKLIMLTTCEYTYSDGSGRLVIMGRTPESEPDPTKVAITCSGIGEIETLPYRNHILIAAVAILASFIIILIVLLIRRRR